ncbi:hypothetical protein JHV675_51690 [Mycobacterium avium subsp. hominissuis]
MALSRISWAASGARARPARRVAAPMVSPRSYPVITRGSYVDPRVITGYERGLTIGAATRRAGRADKPAGRR